LPNIARTPTGPQLAPFGSHPEFAGSRVPAMRLSAGPCSTTPSPPESVPTAIIFYFHHRLPAILLFIHQAHRSIAYLMPPLDAIENP